MKINQKRVAIVYDRVNKWGGAERVLLSLHELFPEATLFTSVYDDKGATWAREFGKIKTSFLQKIPFAKRNHEYFALVMPVAFESFDFSKYDLVVSVTSEAAKGIIVGPNTLHICYCLTPTRYLWSGRKTYFNSKLKRSLAAPVISYLRKWDKIASTRADSMFGISTAVKGRIRKYYKRESQVIFPPVDVERYRKIEIGGKKEGEYYLVVSRLVKYKKVDLAIKAFNKLGKKLLIVGIGREERLLKKIAQKNIKFLGEVSDLELAKLYNEAKALVFPQNEDFGLVAVEAQAACVPVIAYKKGGARDTVISHVTGIFFNKQTPESLIEAVKVFEGMRFNQKDLVKNAKRFSKERFLKEFGRMVSQQ